MEAKLRVCLVIEGSYPYITGGVSAWVQDILEGLPDIDFALFTISPTADQPLRYRLPPNVVEHKDLVITKSPQTPGLGKESASRLPAEILRLHRQFFQGDSPEIDSLFRLLPEGVSLHQDAVEQKVFWDFIVQSNQERNPIYPFSDYYWAWQSSHELLFRVLAAVPPEADIYHAVSTGFAGIAALAAKVRRKKPFILTEHGLYHKEREIEIRKANYVHGYQRDMWIKFYASVSVLCYRNADAVTALFEENRQKQLELGASKDRTFVIPNGIDVERFSSISRKPRPGRHIGLVGRIVPIKDVKTFIAAAKIIAEEIPDVTFYAIGPTDEDPDYYQDCLALAESLSLGDRLQFTGRQNVLEVYAFLDVVVLTSVREAQPLVILEAWAAGIPCVSTKVGNVPEMLDYDERFLAASKDPSQVAAALRFVLNHPEEMEAINERNSEKVRRFYHRSELLEKTRGLYRLVGGP